MESKLQSRTNYKQTFYRTPEGRHSKNAPFTEAFTSFSWRGEDSWEQYGCFIINEGDDLKWLGQSTSNNYSAPLFGSNSQTILSTTFDSASLTLKLGLYGITVEDYRKFFVWMNPLVIDRLYFHYDSEHYYMVKPSSINEATKYIIGYVNSRPVYYAETEVTFEIQGELCGWSNTINMWGPEQSYEVKHITLKAEDVVIISGDHKQYLLAADDDKNTHLNKTKTAYGDLFYIPGFYTRYTTQEGPDLEIDMQLFETYLRNTFSPLVPTVSWQRITSQLFWDPTIGDPVVDDEYCNTLWSTNLDQANWISDLRNSLQVQLQLYNPHSDTGQPRTKQHIRIEAAPLIREKQFIVSENEITGSFDTSETEQVITVWDSDSLITLCDISFSEKTPEWLSFVYDSTDGLVYRTADKKLLTLTSDAVTNLLLNKFLLPSKLEDADFYNDKWGNRIRDIGIRIFINGVQYETNVYGVDSTDTPLHTYIEIHSYMKTPII